MGSAESPGVGEKGANHSGESGNRPGRVQDLLKLGCSGTEGNTEPKGPTTLSQYRQGDTGSGNFGVQSVDVVGGVPENHTAAQGAWAESSPPGHVDVCTRGLEGSLRDLDSHTQKTRR